MSDFKKRRATAALFLAATGLVGATACDDPFGLKATTAVASDTLVIYAMTGTASSFPAGFNAASGALTRITPDITFDVAFDLTSDNKVRLVPARLVSGTRSSFGGVQVTQQVGMQAPSSTFDAVTKAPTGGYKRDSVMIVGTAQPVVIEVNSDACQFSLATQLYAKIVVDSVKPVTRQIFFRATRNPNCGFRSFQPGVPKN